METISDILNYDFISIGSFSLDLKKLLLALLILFSARIVFFMTYRLVLARFYRRRKIDTGRRFAINRIVKYNVYLIAILLAIQATGIQLSLIWAGGAALLAGIAFGMQNTFADLVGGIFLLLEGEVEVGDVVIVDNLVGTIKNIGLRTSTIETLDQIMIIVPNSKLVSENVTNWSSGGQIARFQVDVRVAYDSDVTLVNNLLLQAALEHRDVLRQPRPVVMLDEFGMTGLHFVLHFFSSELLRIELLKSEVRFRIFELFTQQGIEIPFPQNELRIHSTDSAGNPRKGMQD